MAVVAPDGAINVNLQSLNTTDDLDLEYMEIMGDPLNDMEEPSSPKKEEEEKEDKEG